MNKEEIKNIILDYVRKNNNVSFVEIEELFEKSDFSYKGEYSLNNIGGYENIIIWVGWNKEAISLINELMKEKKVYTTTCNVLVYLIDGKYLGYPIAKRLYNYKKVHWAPTVIKRK